MFGGVIYGPDDAVWDCWFADISESGAMVRTDANPPVGTFVDLKITKLNDIRRCKVMWARGGHLGLEFLIKIDAAKHNMAEFFKVVRD